MPFTGSIIMFFHTRADTVGITKKGAMIKIRTTPWPHIGWSSSIASNTPRTTVISRTPPTIISVGEEEEEGSGEEPEDDGEGGHQTRHFLVSVAIYDALRRVYGGQAKREPDNYFGYSDHRPDLTLCIEGQT